MSYTLVLEWMPGDLYMSAVTARCTAPTSSYSVVWLPPNKVYQITLYCGSTSLVSFLVGAFRGKAWSYMNTTYFRLTKSENEIMELLWREGRPLSRSEIIDLTPDRTWKPASIHILLNSMLEKGAIQVAGFVQSTKNYARTFTPTLTADEYAVLQFKHSSAFNEQSVLCLVSALVEDIQDQDTLAKLGDILEKRKLQLG